MKSMKTYLFITDHNIKCEHLTTEPPKSKNVNTLQSKCAKYMLLKNVSIRLFFLYQIYIYNLSILNKRYGVDIIWAKLVR